MATRKKKTEWPKVTVGSHLTVKTFEDGSTELVWDDEALLKDVQNAILMYNTAKTKPRKKVKNDQTTS